MVGRQHTPLWRMNSDAGNFLAAPARTGNRAAAISAKAAHAVLNMKLVSSLTRLSNPLPSGLLRDAPSRM